MSKYFRFINFESEKTDETRHRVNQPPCNGCGNCVSGCNTGAKNTLNMNYLPDAKVHGAEMFTQVSFVLCICSCIFYFSTLELFFAALQALALWIRLLTM